MNQIHENSGEVALAQVRQTIIRQMKERFMTLSQDHTNGKTAVPQPRRRDLFKAARDYDTLTAGFSPVPLDMFKQLAEPPRHEVDRPDTWHPFPAEWRRPASGAGVIRSLSTSNASISS
jgi:hypothetical protein